MQMNSGLFLLFNLNFIRWEYRLKKYYNNVYRIKDEW